jgi:hypothetical protein
VHGGMELKNCRPKLIGNLRVCLVWIFFSLDSLPPCNNMFATNHSVCMSMCGTIFVCVKQYFCFDSL